MDIRPYHLLMGRSATSSLARTRHDTLTLRYRPDPRVEAAIVNAERLRGLRQRLLDSGAFTIEDVARGRGATLAATRKAISRAEVAGKIVTVMADGHRLVPTIFLDEAFELVPHWEPVFAALRAAGEVGWGQWAWCAEPSTWLDGQAPADLITTSPAIVWAAAERRLESLEATS